MKLRVSIFTIGIFAVPNRVLQVTDPYAHYSHRGQPCYQKLFDGKTSGEDDDWWEHIE